MHRYFRDNRVDDQCCITSDIRSLIKINYYMSNGQMTESIDKSKFDGIEHFSTQFIKYNHHLLNEELNIKDIFNHDFLTKPLQFNSTVLMTNAKSIDEFEKLAVHIRKRDESNLIVKTLHLLCESRVTEPNKPIKSI